MFQPREEWNVIKTQLTEVAQIMKIDGPASLVSHLIDTALKIAKEDNLVTGPALLVGPLTSLLANGNLHLYLYNDKILQRKIEGILSSALRLRGDKVGAEQLHGANTGAGNPGCSQAMLDLAARLSSFGLEFETRSAAPVSESDEQKNRERALREQNAQWMRNQEELMRIGMGPFHTGSGGWSPDASGGGDCGGGFSGDF